MKRLLFLIPLLLSAQTVTPPNTGGGGGGGLPSGCSSPAAGFLACTGGFTSGASGPAVTGSGIVGIGESSGQACVTNADCLIADSVTHALLLSNNNGTSTHVTQTVASGTAVLGTALIASGTCATAVTATATGVLATDAITTSFNVDPTSTTGYSPVTTGILTIIPYPTANAVNYKVCNLTASGITPGAVTLNWRVTR